MAGGILDQPAPLLAVIRSLDFRTALVRKICELNEAIEKQAQALNAAMQKLAG